jgi:hypothetical protein
MHDSETVGGGRGAEIAPIDNRHREASECRIPSDARSMDARTHDQEIESLVYEGRRVAPHG